MGWTDSHCHVPYQPGGDQPSDRTIGDADAELAAARTAGVDRLVTVGTDAPSSRAALDFARRADGVWATIGLHPHEARHGLGDVEAMLADHAGDDEVVAVGECGLDYHYDHSPRDEQRAAFAAQIALAHVHDLALVIHSRSAWDDTFAVLEGEGVPDRTVFHCFTGGPAEARRALDLGCHLSFSGIVTFPSAGELREAVALAPVDRVLVETDAPYLAPVPHRGKPNRPAFVPLVGATVAEVTGRSAAAVERSTAEAAAAVFGLPPPG